MNTYCLKSIHTQVSCLKKHFPQLDVGRTQEIDLPEHIQGLTVPKWQRIAQSYEWAVRDVVDRIKDLLNVLHPRGYHVTVPNNLCQTELSSRFYDQSTLCLTPDILVIPGMFSTNYPLIRNGLGVHSSHRPLPLGSFANAIIVLNHLDQLIKYEDILISSEGDVSDVPTDSIGFSAPLISIYRNHTGSDAFWYEHASGYWISSVECAA